TQILLEIGLSGTLSTLVHQHPGKATEQVVLTSLHRPQQADSDVAFLLHTLGQLWIHGVEVDWSGFYAHEQRRRVPLPTYPLERRRCWIDPPPQAEPTGGAKAQAEVTPLLVKKPDMAYWFYIPAWKRAPLMPPQSGEIIPSDKVMVFMDACQL